MKSWWLSPWQLLIGLSTWAVWFVVVYGGVSLACAVLPIDAQAARLLRLSFIAFTLTTAALLAAAAIACGRAARALSAARALPNQENAEDPRFIAAGACALHAMAAFSTVFVGLPLLVLPPCV